MQFKKAKRRKNKKFTILFIPHASESKINSLGIPIWLINGLACFGIVSILIFSYLIFSYFSLQYTVIENRELKKVNQVQSAEIEKLYKATDQALEELKKIQQTDEKVRNLIGIQKEGNKKKETELTSRFQGGLGTRYVQTFTSGINEEDFFVPQSENNLREKEEKGLDKITVIKQNIVNISSLCEEQSEVLNILEKDVKKQLAYLNAMPDRWPLRGKITSPYGWRKNPFNHRKMEFHEGIDIKGNYGTAIRAAGSGTVTFKGWKPGYGNTVIINHGYGYTSQYAHCSKMMVKIGQKVEKGEIIARVGNTGRSTGPHLDFRIAKNGQWINPQKVLK